MKRKELIWGEQTGNSCFKLEERPPPSPLSDEVATTLTS